MILKGGFLMFFSVRLSICVIAVYVRSYFWVSLFLNYTLLLWTACPCYSNFEHRIRHELRGESIEFTY